MEMELAKISNRMGYGSLLQWYLLAAPMNQTENLM